MSKDILEKKLDILIKLVENLPEAFLKAFEKNKEIQKQIRLKECQDDIEFCHHNIRAVNDSLLKEKACPSSFRPVDRNALSGTEVPSAH